MDDFMQTLESLERRGLLRAPRTLEEAQGPVVSIHGKKLVNLCSNDYLGLAAHPAVIEGTMEAARRFGAGSGSSRLVAGTLEIHLDFEHELARFKGFEAALLMSTGYMANLGVLQALLSPADAVFSDALNHASIVDGCRLSRAAVQIYPHKDASTLEKMLQKAKGFRRRLIVTESVFSMDGDIAPLPALIELKERHDALLVVDEAHATGVLGRSGKGALEHFGLQGGADVLIGTLGKALGSFGAFVCSSGPIREYFINTARAFIFTTGLPPSAVGGARAALRLIQEHPDRIVRLWQNAANLKSGLASIGFGIQSETPILPLILGKADDALAIGNALFERGVFVAPIRPPSVPEGTSRLRITPTAAHTFAQIQSALEAFSLEAKRLGLLA